MFKKIFSFALLFLLFFVQASFAETDVLKLKSSSNDPGGDYFIGSPAELTPVIQSLVKDNSKLDSAYLYIAANTALNLNRLTDAGFLFYAAQIRKAFDTKRYNLQETKADNVLSYLVFLNDTVGRKVNPILMANTKNFSEAIDMLESWNPVPTPSAIYKEYGKAAIEAKDWAALGKSIKEDFMTNFGRKMKKFFMDPKNVEAFKMVQDYNFKKIPHNPENEKKYNAAMEILYKNGVQ